MHPNKLKLLSFFILLTNFVSGQKTHEVNLLANKFIITLKAKNIDTVCIYQSYCIGCIYNFKDKDRCNFKGLVYLPTYILWLDNGKTFMTKKDNCFDYSTIEIQKDGFWNFYFINQETIKKETIKEPQFKVIENGQEKIHSSFIDHSHHQNIKIIIQQNITIDKDLDEYFFEKEIGIEKNENINYDYNVNSNLNKLADLISITIKDETKKQKLLKTRR